jgi:hypothetical protein
MKGMHYERLKTPLGIIQFYEDQLAKFDDMSIGSFTEDKVEITETLIGRTKLRLNQLIDKYLDKFEDEHRI